MTEMRSYKRFFEEHRFPILLLLVCCWFYFSFAYDVVREDLPKLFGLYLGLFLLTWKFYQFGKPNMKLLLGAAILFRLVFLFSLPNLSQDFYRFIWDGRLLLDRVNPYLLTPNEIMAKAGSPISGAAELVSGMGELSAGNYSNYPPIHQLVFLVAAFFSGKSILGAVITMRLIIILADLGIFYFGRRLLKERGISENRIFWYLLNPFIIIELTGNLHFEGLMLFFLVWSLFLLHRRKWFLSAVVFSASISVKLVPLIFLPLLIVQLGTKKALKYFGVMGLCTLLLFSPFLASGFFSNYTQTVGLWFQKFEFNASVYYLIRWIGFKIQGYNIIGTAGSALALLVFLFVLYLAFLKRNRTVQDFHLNMLLAVSAYLFLATTIHPWYLSTLLLLCLFTRFRFPMLWSLVVVLSYSAYATPDFKENLWLVSLEYLVVFGFLFYEFFLEKEHKKRPGETGP